MAQGVTHGVVLGGGMAGMLAAAALAAQLDTVTVVDRDRFADDAKPRKGVPQARHLHLLLSRGADTLDALLPGMSQDLVAAGARHIPVTEDLLMYTPSGWVPRLPDLGFVVSASRGLIDLRIRRRVLGDARITVAEGTDVVGLLGDQRRVTGARVRERDSGTVREIAADVVVDATGRSSKAPEWLTALGYPAVTEVVMDGGVSYSTRLFRATTDEGRCPAVYIQPDTDNAGQGGALLPIEDDTWVVSLSGMRGGEPPSDEQQFTAFARGLPHPLVADLLGAMEPVGPVHGYRGIVNRQRQFERMSPAPDGFLALGDSACIFNPVYGQGMTVAALGALALRDQLRRHGLRPGLTKRVQRAAAWAAFDPWNTVTARDRCYPETVGPPATALDRLVTRYVNQVGRTSTVRPVATRAIVDAYTMATPLVRLFSPSVILAAIRGPGRGWTVDPSPPLTPAEETFLKYATAAPRP